MKIAVDLVNASPQCRRSNSQAQRVTSYMLTFEQSAAIFDRIRRYSSADEVELLISGNRFALTRFANNAIHQNVADENQLISVRTNFGGRTAREQPTNWTRIAFDVSSSLPRAWPKCSSRTQTCCPCLPRTRLHRTSKEALARRQCRAVISPRPRPLLPKSALKACAKW